MRRLSSIALVLVMLLSMLSQPLLVHAYSGSTTLVDPVGNTTPVVPADTAPLSEAYQASLTSLLTQLSTQGIETESMNVIYPSGTGNDIRVSYEILQAGRATATLAGTQAAQVRFMLEKPSTEPVNFQYTAMSGSADAGRHLTGVTSGMVSFAAGDTERIVAIEIAPFADNPGKNSSANNTDAFWTGERYFYLYCHAIENALFAGNRYSMTVPVPIESLFNFVDAYHNATNTTLIDLENVTGASSAGVYTTTNGGALTLTAEIAGDVRTMLDAGVLSHIRLPDGYFLNESGIEGIAGFRVQSYQPPSEEKPTGYGPITDGFWSVGLATTGQTSFYTSELLQSQPVESFGLGPPLESNRIISRLDFTYSFSSVTSPVKTCFLNSDGSYLRHQVSLIDDMAPTVSDVYVETTGRIHCGDFIPVVVTFSEPVHTENITMTVEDVTLQPMESSATISNAVSFLYEVGDDFLGDTVVRVSVERITGAVDLSGKPLDAPDPHVTYLATAMLAAFRPALVFSYCAEPEISLNQGTTHNATATVNIPVKRDIALSNWLIARKTGSDISTAVKARVIDATNGAIDVPLTIHLDGGYVTSLSGSFTAPENTTGSDVYYGMELYLDSTGAGTFSQILNLTTIYAVPPLILINDVNDITLDYTAWPPENIVFADAAASLALGYQVNVDATWQDPSYFSWSSSDPSIATIETVGVERRGIITLSDKAGTVHFTLSVSNPLSEEIVTVTSRMLTVKETDSPYLYIPKGLTNLDLLTGNDAKLSFATNLTSRNGEYGGTGTETVYMFTLHTAVYDGTSPTKGAVLSSETRIATTLQPITTYTVPASLLPNTTEKDRYGYILEISTHDRQSGQRYDAEANIRMRDLPAKAMLARPETLYVTDRVDQVDIRFAIDNKNAGTEYLLTVLRNSESSPVFSTSALSDIDRTLSAGISNVSHSRLLDVYTVTLKAKNQSDEAWSYDSYFVYVYNHYALEIFVNGFPGPYNLPMEAAFSDGLVAYSTDPFWYSGSDLWRHVSINRHKYAWSTIADKVSWSVDGDSVSLWYSDGGVQQQLGGENTPLLLPGTGLILRAAGSGRSVVTATHALTGMSDSMFVDVQPINHRLFMFQSYPPMRTEIKYRNGNGANRSYTTNESGKLTVHESSGIAGDVLLYPAGDNAAIYDYGILTNNRMTATQSTAGSFALYPVNTVLLPQRNHRVTLSFFEHDTGAAYTGPVILRGGVFLNGHYKPTTINTLNGSTDQTVSAGTDGRYTLKLAASGITDNHHLTPDDKIDYVIEARFPDNSHIPMFIKIDSEAVWKNRASPLGVSLQRGIQALDTDSIQNHVIVLSESLMVNGKHMSLNDTNPLGELPETASLAMEMIIPGGYRTAYMVGLEDQSGTVRSVTSVERSESYPFAEISILSGTADMSQGLTDILKYYNKPGSRFNLFPVITAQGLEIRLSKPIQVLNLINMPYMEEGLTGSYIGTISMFNNIRGDGYYGVGNGLVADALAFLSNYKMSAGHSAGLEITPTDDPLVYKGVFRLAVGTYDRDNPSGIFVASGSKQEFSYMPGVSDMRAMQKGVFLKKSKDAMNKSKDHSKGFYYSYGGGAYLECEIFYDVDQQKWMMRLLTSDTYIGGGGGYKYTVNGSIGPVPVTATLQAGMTATVGLKIVTDKTKNSTTYVPYLYPGMNLYAFGGIGADYDVVAFKAGPYGMIEHKQEYLWVNNNERNGQHFSISGETGVQFTAKLLFVEYNAKWKWGGAYDSWSYGNYYSIYYDYFIPEELKRSLFKPWRRIGVGGLGYMASEDFSTMAFDDREAISFGTDNTGPMLMPAETTVTFEDRSYLYTGERSWGSPSTGMRMFDSAGTTGSGMTEMWRGAYPYASPSMTSDGDLLVYLSDMDSTDFRNTKALFSVKSDGLFPEGTIIDASDGSAAYPDSNLSLSGSIAQAAAVWNRSFDSFDGVSGGTATGEDLVKALASTEVMAGVYREGVFTTTRLTNNNTPDLSPTVASAGDNAIAAWRSVTLGDLANPLAFSSDALMVALYGSTGTEASWGEAKTIYDGSIDRINAVSAAMLPDGTSAIAYQITEADGGDTEIMCAVLDENGTVRNTVRLTDNDQADVAPQITTALFPDDNHRFVIGWTASTDTDENTFQLRAINADGTLYPEFQLELIGGTGSAGNTRFAQGADKIEDLSLVWFETDPASDYAADGTRRDILWGRKLLKSADGNISASGKLKIQELPEFTTVDTFDPHVSPATGEIHAALLLTEHSTTDDSSAGKSAIMGTAAYNYQNMLTMTEPYYDHADILPGLSMPIQFTVTNDGVAPISTLTIALESTTQTYTDQNIAPGETATFTVLYEVPNSVIDVDYTITAQYAALPDEAQGGSLKLSLPDAGLHAVDLIRKTNRERSFHVLMRNSTYAKLIPGTHTVRLDVYDTPNFNLYGFDGAPIHSRTFSDAASLEKLNESLLPATVTLDAEDLTGILNSDGEIPEGGATLFFRTVVTEKGEVIEDADLSNDMYYTKVFSLMDQAGTAVSLASLTLSEGGQTRVQVEAFNNSMNAIPNGNLTVTLKDAQGSILETRQSYRSAVPESLLVLAGETGVGTTMAFDHIGASAEVMFSTVAADSTKLSALKLLGVPLLFDKSVYQYDIQTYDLTETTFTAVAENPASVISVTRNGSPVTLGLPCALRGGLNTFLINVTTGTVVVPYMVNVNNQISSGEKPINGRDSDTTIDDSGTYRASLSLSGMTTSFEIIVDKDTGHAVIDLGDWARTFFQGEENATLTLPAIPDVTAYTFNIPADAMTGAYGKASLTVQTALGSLKISSGMLTGMTDHAGKTAGLTIAKGDKAQLSATTQAAIGDRPLLALTLTLDGIPTDWNNPDAPVTVRIPYTPTADEQKNPESLVIWHIDNAGRVVTVPNGRYDAGTDTVIFHTTHFSAYAVAHNSVSFHDVPTGTWYETAVRFLAARDITKGTGGGYFSPNAKLTRGDFLVLLMRSHGISPELYPKDNFADAGNTYWTGYLAAAKVLGVTTGVGNNLYAPGREIARQEAFTLLYNALKATGQLPKGESNMTLEQFSDGDEIHSWAQEAVAHLIRAGIIRGNRNALSPLGTTTRAEMAQTLFNLLSKP